MQSFDKKWRNREGDNKTKGAHITR